MGPLALDPETIAVVVGAIGEVGAAIASGYLLYLTQQAGYLTMLRKAAKMNRALRQKGAKVDEALTLESMDWETLWRKQ